MIIKTHGILLIYDITNRKTFDRIPEWIKDIKDIRSDLPIILCGNKNDLKEKRVILKEEGEELSKKYNVIFYEISNKEGTNIRESGLELINKIIEQNNIIGIEKDNENNMLNNNIVEKNTTNTKKIISNSNKIVQNIHNIKLTKYLSY